MASVTFEYDAVRGGFTFRLGAVQNERRRNAFGGFLSIHSDESGRICTIESDFGDHGGVPLRGIHGIVDSPQGEYSVVGGELVVGPVRLRQSEERLELLFGVGEDLLNDRKEGGVTLRLSQQKALAGWPVPDTGIRSECPLVAGITVDFAKAVAAYPITALVLEAVDIKG